MPPPTPSSTSSTQEASASPDAGNVSKALVTFGGQASNKGEPAKGNDPMVTSIGTLDKVAGSAISSLKRKKKEEILKLAQSSLEKQTLTPEAVSQETEDVKLVSLLD